MALGLELAFWTILDKNRRDVGLAPARVKRNLDSPSGLRTGTAWEPIAEHRFFAGLADALDEPLDVAFLAYVGAVANTLDPASKLIVDRVLALRLDAHHAYDTKVGERRTRLFPAWKKLLESEGRANETEMAESTFRQSVENATLRSFASELDRPTSKILGALSITDLGELEEFVSDPPTVNIRRASHVVVFGDAVTDMIFRIPKVPAPDTSEQATAFEMHPGGKGLTQAVAAARLGLKVSLIAAIGDDERGETILAYMKREGVGTDLINVVKGEITPVTGVITPDTGISFALGWKNERVAISERELGRGQLKRALATCNCLLVSFEPPLDAVERAISVAHAAGKPVIVTPAPPAERRLLNPKTQQQIDYLVTNAWEAQRFNRRHDDELEVGVQPNFADDADRLLFAGIKHVLVIFDKQCHAFYRTEGSQRYEFQVPSWPYNVHESAGARDAFCAMLALHLAQDRGQFSERAVFWATAAMSYAGGMLGVPDSMPTLAQVEDIVRAGSIVIPDD